TGFFLDSILQYTGQIAICSHGILLDSILQYIGQIAICPYSPPHPLIANFLYQLFLFRKNKNNIAHLIFLIYFWSKLNYN
ncbi:hypothetical protein, partial [Myroides odoratus]|uniref:hypothetical protein n=1 Tax=Myroides odoratus TaxID=256 RepID=UPI001E3CFB97